MRITEAAIRTLILSLWMAFLALGLGGCPTSDSGPFENYLNIRITETNDSLLTMDSLVIRVYRADNRDSQTVFEGILRDKNQLLGIRLKDAIGTNYRVVITGFKAGAIAINREVSVSGGVQAGKKDLPVVTLLVLKAPGDTTIAENDSLHLMVMANDTGTVLEAKDLPQGARFATITRGIGALSWRPGFEQSGSFTVTFSAVLGAQTQTHKIQITVTKVNRPPKLSPVENKTGQPGIPISFQIAATDPDGPDGLIVSVDVKTLPQGATFSQGTFSWTPSAAQTGNYPVKFRAEDGTATDSLTVVLSMGKANRPPSLAFTSDTTLFENDSLVLQIISVDPDGTTPKLFILGDPELPRGCSIAVDQPQSGKGQIAWRPDFDQGRKDPYRFVIQAEDESTRVEKMLTITVHHLNRPPKLAEIGNKAINMGEILSFEITATDPDGDSLTYLADMPAEATFSNRRFSWTPKITPAGNYPVTFKVTDGFALDSKTIVVSVGAVSRPPEFALLNDVMAKVGDSLSIDITATDPEGKEVAITAMGLPPGSKLTQTAPGKAVLTWRIDSDPPKDTTHTITLSADDGGEKASRTLRITLIKIGPRPIADAGKDTAVSIKDTVNLHGSVTGPASLPLIWEWDIGNTGAFKKISKGDTAIQAGSMADSALLCVLKVTDPHGRVDRDTLRIRITDNPPKAYAGSDTLVGLIGSKTLMGKGQDDGRLVKYEWDIGNKGVFNEAKDGQALLSAQGLLPLDFTCVLRVTDDDGHTSLDTMIAHFNMDWREANSTAAFPERAEHGFLVFNDKLWVMGGPGSDDVWYSADGTEWKAATVSAGWGQRDRFATIVFGGKMWLFGGNGWSQPGESDGLRSDVWNTSDGANWNKVLTTGGYPPSQDFDVLAYNNKLWMVTRINPVPSDLSISDFQVWVSDDALTWQKVAEKLPYMAYQKFTAEVFDGKMWILGNDNDSTSSIATWSTDGRTWKSVKGPDSFLPRTGHSSAVYDGKLWIFGGMARNDATYRNDIWYSADGSLWKQATSTAPFKGRIAHKTVVFKTRIWLTGGTAKRGGYRDVWFSEDKP